jgi:hypothetical protein
LIVYSLLLLVSGVAYSSTLKMEVMLLSKRRIASELHVVIIPEGGQYDSAEPTGSSLPECK